MPKETTAEVGDNLFLRLRARDVLRGSLMGAALVVSCTLAVITYQRDTAEALRRLDAKMDQIAEQVVMRGGMSAWIQDVNAQFLNQAKAIQTGARVDPIVLPDINRYPNPRQAIRRDDQDKGRPAGPEGANARRMIVGNEHASY